MKRILLFSCLIAYMLFSYADAFSQNPGFEWAKKLEHSPYSDIYSNAVLTDSIGNIYIAGDFDDTLYCNPGPGSNVLTALGKTDVFICKLDSSGTFLWAKSFGGKMQEDFADFKLDKQGNVIITGSFWDTSDFDPGPGVYNLTAGPSNKPDGYVLKLDSQGNFIWAKKLDGDSAFCQSFCVAIDDQGSVYTSGYFIGTIDFDPGLGVYNLVSSASGCNEVFVLKLDSYGNFIWAKASNTLSTGSFTDFTMGNSIAVNKKHDVYVAGDFYGKVDFDPSGNIDSISSKGDYDGFIMKLNAAGDLSWVKSIGGKLTDRIYSINLDAIENPIVSGRFEDTVDFNPGIPVYTSITKGGSDVFILKLDTLANFNWVKTIGGKLYDYPANTTIDSFGNIYTTGIFKDTVDFDPGSDVHTLENAKKSDVFFQKLDNSGNFLWAKNLGNNLNDFAAGSLAINNYNELIAVGRFRDTADFDPTDSIYNLTTSGYGTLFILKWNQKTTFPLHLLTFTAKRANTTNLLNWTTAQEVNTDRFEIERSYNGREFRKIGVVKAGNTTYTFTDNNPLKGVNYYRLKMMDKDGQFTYSPIRQLTINNSPLTINIFPNPAHNKLQLQIESDKKVALKMDIITQDGKVVLSSNMAAAAGSLLRSINIAALQSGTYFLRVTSSAGEQNVVKFEKL